MKQLSDLTLEEARAVISAMNGISSHQTDRLFGDMQIDETVIKMRFHPLTCGNDSNHTPLFPFFENGSVKLICRDCNYTQDNGAMFSFEASNEK